MIHPPAHYILGLGGNLGDRAQVMAQAIAALEGLPGAEVVGVSPAFETDPVGYADQPKFINICLALSYEESPESLLAETQAIEARSGRIRTDNRNGPRPLDIDLLFWRGGIRSSGALELPHPRWKSRGFVVIPLRHLLEQETIVKDSAWDSLRTEAGSLATDGAGLRPWQGPTPWIKKKD
ncbi:MAG: 2-amino-4-hydroxy-6-hydroxymethyldihydropteridine diphosphokinase [Opitutales bacterium]